MTGTEKNRRWIRKRRSVGLAELWMIGYDGPRPLRSWWPIVRAHGRLFYWRAVGGKRREAPLWRWNSIWRDR